MTHRKSNLVTLVLVLVVIASLFTIPSLAYAEKVAPGTYAYINVETYLRLRDAPQGEILGQVKRGTKVYIVSGPDRDHYYQIDFNGGCYYVYGGDNWEYLSSTKPGSTGTKTTTTTTTTKTNSGKQNQEPTSLGIAAIVCGEMVQADKFLDYSNVTKDYMSDKGVVMFVSTTNMKLNLRSEPRDTATRRRFLDRGEIVTVYPNTRSGNYVKVKAWLDGRTGWCLAKYLSEEIPGDILYIWDIGNGALNMILGEAQCFAGCAENCPCQCEECDEWKQMYYGDN